MERLTERTTDGILVKENHGENGLRTFYQCFEENKLRWRILRNREAGRI